MIGKFKRQVMLANIFAGMDWQLFKIKGQRAFRELVNTAFNICGQGN